MFRIAAAALAAFFSIQVAAAEPPAASKVRFQWGVKIPMRDGIKLNATAYVPRQQAAPAPCIFTLTPYISQSYHDRGIYFASHGLAFLTVDVRGRGNSDGRFRPMLQEAKDGHDVVEWLAKQPYCNGKVTMWGGSYAGYDQWAAAKEMPPHLATIVPAAAAHPGVDFPYRNNISYPYTMQWLTFTRVWPYLPLMKEDGNLQELIKGVINRQVKCILKDPYANAFYKDETKISEWKDDKTEMKPGIHERKWEIDSLCYPIRLSHGYWMETKDSSIFDTDWREAMRLVVRTFKEQQRLENNGPYKFERTTSWATDGVPLGGYGYPAKKIGLIHSMFRPSDDATVYPFLIPSNAFAFKSLEHLGDILESIKQDTGLR